MRRFLKRQLERCFKKLTKKCLEFLIKDSNLLIKSGSLNLIFEIFEDETFSEVFERLKVLLILEKSAEKMKEVMKKSKSDFSHDEFSYIKDALENLRAFIDYSNYHKFV